MFKDTYPTIRVSVAVGEGLGLVGGGGIWGKNKNQVSLQRGLE